MAGEPRASSAEPGPGRDPESRLAEIVAQWREGRLTGRVRKLSISMPEDLVDALQARVGRGAVSQYVTEAVAERLRLDLLDELLDWLDEEYGPVPQKLVDEVASLWPDAD